MQGNEDNENLMWDPFWECMEEEPFQECEEVFDFGPGHGEADALDEQARNDEEEVQAAKEEVVPTDTGIPMNCSSEDSKKIAARKRMLNE